eukprot:3135547-Pyramimonas_sp.AAC.3
MPVYIIVLCSSISRAAPAEGMMAAASSMSRTGRKVAITYAPLQTMNNGIAVYKLYNKLHLLQRASSACVC